MHVMTRAVLTIVTALSLQPQAAPAQTVAGQWSGKMGQSPERQVAVFMDIKVNGASLSGRVTGPELTPGTIRKGTYDAKSGAVTFEVLVDGDGTVVNFEGKFARDSISGRVGSTDQSGMFSLGRASVPNLAPPAKAADTIAMAMLSGFTQVSGWVTRAAQLVPPDKYTYRPVGTVRTFGQLLGHVIDGYAFYCGKGAGRNVQWSDAAANGPVDKAAVATKLKQASDACSAAYSNAKQWPPLMENIAHTNLHYGNIVTYMRMLGLAPPSS
jgi:uncharacterized damage-inducible protein DinB